MQRLEAFKLTASREAPQVVEQASLDLCGHARRVNPRTLDRCAHVFEGPVTEAGRGHRPYLFPLEREPPPDRDNLPLLDDGVFFVIERALLTCLLCVLARFFDV